MTPDPKSIGPQDRAFRFDSGRACLDFVATVGDRHGRAIERLVAPADLARWCVAAGLLPTPPRITAAGLDAARGLREAVWRAVQARRSGDGRPAARDIGTINRWAARPPLAPQLAGDGRRIWTARRPADAVLASLARDAVDLLAGGDIHRLRECAEPTCSILFVDASRPGKRRWCAMSRCGNRAKKQAYRGRRRAAPG